MELKDGELMCSIDFVYLQEVARTNGVSLQLLVAASISRSVASIS